MKNYLFGKNNSIVYMTHHGNPYNIPVSGYKNGSCTPVKRQSNPCINPGNYNSNVGPPRTNSMLHKDVYIVKPGQPCNTHIVKDPINKKCYDGSVVNVGGNSLSDSRFANLESKFLDLEDNIKDKFSNLEDDLEFKLGDIEDNLDSKVEDLENKLDTIKSDEELYIGTEAPTKSGYKVWISSEGSTDSYNYLEEPVSTMSLRSTQNQTEYTNIEEVEEEIVYVESEPLSDITEFEEQVEFVNQSTECDFASSTEVIEEIEETIVNVEDTNGISELVETVENVSIDII